MQEDRAETRPSKRQKTYKRLSESYLRNAGLYYLQRHAASVAHFIVVMERKMGRSMQSHPEQDLESFKTYLRDVLVPDFVRLGYLNDELYAGGLVLSLSRKGLPEREIIRRVQAKGVQADIVKNAGFLDEHDDLKAAIRMMKRRRLGPFATKERDPQKDMAALARYGFSYDIVKRALFIDAEEIAQYD